MNQNHIIHNYNKINRKKQSQCLTQNNSLERDISAESFTKKSIKGPPKEMKLSHRVNRKLI